MAIVSILLPVYNAESTISETIQSIINQTYKDWELYNAGFYALTLNQAEESCMIKNNNDFTYRKREFAITYQKDGSKQTIKVPEDRIYSLCTDAGKWTRIVPIEIKTNK